MPPPERLRASALRRPLEAARLRLEPLGPGHAQPAFFEGLRDPELYRYETEQPPADLPSLRERFTQLADGSGDEAEVWLNWVSLRRDDATALGYVQATVDVARASATIGYLVLTAHQRRGYGREAVDAMCAHLTAHGVVTLHAWIDVRNTASVALVEGLGFERVATGRSGDVIGGRRGYDHHYVRSAGEGR